MNSNSSLLNHLSTNYGSYNAGDKGSVTGVERVDSLVKF